MGITSKVAKVARKTALSTGGPMLFAGANFLVSLAAIPVLDSASFGTLAFLMALAQFFVAVSTGLVASPMSVEMQYDKSPDVKAAFFCGTVVYAFVAALAMFVISNAVAGDTVVALGFATYTFFLIHRLVDRAYFIAISRPYRSLATDICYFLAMSGGVAWLHLSSHVDLASASITLAVSALVATCIGSFDVIPDKIRSATASSLRHYLAHWKSSVGWTFLGVVATDLTLNAHGYAVTLLLGPASYAPIAVAALAWRPFVIVLYSVSSFERAAIARHNAAGDVAGVRRSVLTLEAINALVYGSTFAVGAGAIVLGTGALSSPDYPPSHILFLFLLIAASMAIRSVREPLVQALNASRQYRRVTICACISGAVGVVSTFTLAFTLGAWQSILGIVLADLTYLVGAYMAYTASFPANAASSTAVTA